MANLNDEFLKTYDEVFDENGCIRNCGREKCKKLINIANMLDPSAKYGDSNSGMINEYFMKQLHCKLSK